MFQVFLDISKSNGIGCDLCEIGRILSADVNCRIPQLYKFKIGSIDSEFIELNTKL